MQVVYFELNNWSIGRDYPDAEPFISWFTDPQQNFNNEKWVKENKLCVVSTLIDMSCNYCVTAPKSWVLKNCPDLLSDKKYETTFIRGVEQYAFNQFLRFPDPDKDNQVYGRFGTKFLEYTEDNIGITYIEEDF